MPFTQPKAACTELAGLQEASAISDQLKPDGKRLSGNVCWSEAGSDAACVRVDFFSLGFQGRDAWSEDLSEGFSYLTPFHTRTQIKGPLTALQHRL